MKEILCAGYIALDLISYKDRLAHRAGGTAGNVAANLAYLGWNARVAGVIGHDAAARVLLSDLKKVGVNIDDMILRPEGGTPLVLHEIREPGHRFWFHCPECGRRFPKFRPLDEDQAMSLSERLCPDVFFFDRSSASTASLAEAFHAKGALIVFEPSTQGREFERCVRAADVFKYSSDRASSIASRVSGIAPLLQIVTDGKSGVDIQFKGRTTFHLPAFDVQVLDAGGAGDWTTAGLLWKLLDSPPSSWSAADVQSAVREGQALAAISCAYPGARTVVDHLTRTEMLAAAQKLIAAQSPALSTASLPRRTRQRASRCSSCLAAT
jgi:fructokinase